MADPFEANVPLLFRTEDSSNWTENSGYLRGEFVASGSFNFIANGPYTDFGAGSRTAPGAGSRGTFPHDDSLDGFDGAFTIELWNYIEDLSWSTRGLCGKWNTTGNNRSWGLQWAVTQSIFAYLSFNGTGADVTLSGDPGSPYIDVWRHICLERNSSGLIRLYADGVVLDSTTNSNTVHQSTGADVFFGNFNNNARRDDRVSMMRITNGVARYDGAFTPPSDPFPVVPELGEGAAVQVSSGASLVLASDEANLQLSSAAALVLWGEPSEVQVSSAALLTLGRQSGRRIIGITD